MLSAPGSDRFGLSKVETDQIKPFRFGPDGEEVALAGKPDEFKPVADPADDGMHRACRYALRVDVDGAR